MRTRFTTNLEEDAITKLKLKADELGLSNVNELLEQGIKNGFLTDKGAAIFQDHVMVTKFENMADIGPEEMSWFIDKLHGMALEVSKKTRGATSNDERSSCLAIYGIILRLQEAFYEEGKFRMKVTDEIKRQRGES